MQSSTVPYKRAHARIVSAVVSYAIATDNVAQTAHKSLTVGNGVPVLLIADCISTAIKVFDIEKSRKTLALLPVLNRISIELPDFE